MPTLLKYCLSHFFSLRKLRPCSIHGVDPFIKGTNSSLWDEKELKIYLQRTYPERRREIYRWGRMRFRQLSETDKNGLTVIRHSYCINTCITKMMQMSLCDHQPRTPVRRAEEQDTTGYLTSFFQTCGNTLRAAKLWGKNILIAEGQCSEHVCLATAVNHLVWHTKPIQ